MVVASAASVFSPSVRAGEILQHLQRTATTLGDQVRSFDETGIVGRLVSDWLFDLPNRFPWPLNLAPDDISDLTLRALAQATLDTPRTISEPERIPLSDALSRLAARAAQLGRKFFAYEDYPGLAKYVLKHYIPLDEGPWGLFVAVKRVRLANMFERQVERHADTVLGLFRMIEEKYAHV